MTQKELAKLAKTEKGNLNRILKGRQNARRTLAARLELLTDVPAGAWMSATVSPPEDHPAWKAFMDAA